MAVASAPKVMAAAADPKKRALVARRGSLELLQPHQQQQQRQLQPPPPPQLKLEQALAAAPNVIPSGSEESASSESGDEACRDGKPASPAGSPGMDDAEPRREPGCGTWVWI